MVAWKAWGRYSLAAAVSILIGWVAFGAKSPVPVLDQFDLGVHEVGHLVAYFLPQTAMFLAGSVAQVAVPLGLAAYFLFRRREWASAGFCLAWAGTSGRDVAVYVADAPIQALPLVGGGTHDWAYLLGPEGWDCLTRAGAVARGIEVFGLCLVVAAVAVSLWRPARRLWSPGRLSGVGSTARARPAAPVVADPSGDPWLAAGDPWASAGARAGEQGPA